MAAKTYLKSALIIFAILFLIANLTFAAPPRYEIIDLGTLDGSWHFSVACSINNFGQIVGECENWDAHITRATLFDSSGSGNNIDLGTLGGPDSRAWCINDSGQIVGTADVIIEGAPRGRATLFDPSGGAHNIDLGTLGGLNSEAFSVNKLGQIVGRAALPSISRSNATIFDVSGAANNIDLGTLGGHDSSSLARSINNSGQIVGLGISRGPNPTAFRSAALFDPTGGGQNIDLAKLGGPESGAFSINDAGKIVGWLEFLYGDEHGWHATLFDPSGSGNNIDLDPFAGPGDYSWAWSINNKGLIVGTIQRVGSNPRATLFDPSGAGNNIDLNTLIEPGSEWTLRYAHSINDSGWIVGEGVNPDGQPRAFLLIPQLIIYVDDDAAGANDGSSWADAYNYMRDALTAAWSGDEIHVAQGVYKPDQGAGITPGDREATFQLINGVTIKGGYAGFDEKDPDARDIDLYETILSGDLAGNDEPDFDNNDENSYHVITGSDTDETAVLDGCIVTAGNANGPYANGIDYSDGGGMYNDDGCPTLTNCTFRFNTASNLSYGGAMANKYSKPTLTGCIFIGNQAEIGGAIYNYVSQVTLTDCTFIENSARSGGAIVGHGYLELTNCKFIRNSAGYAGGAINATAMTLNNCLFSENTADYGGAIGVADRSYATLTDCTFSSNSAENGGAIWMFDAGEGPTLTNCSFTENSAYMGGGIHNSSYSSPTLINCTFTANSAEYGGAIQNKRSDPILSHCTFKANIAGNYGGAMVNENQSAPILDYCTFVANNAYSAGGAIISEQENTLILINNSIFAGNSARWGGAILNDDCDQILTGCTFTGNIARTQNSGVIENDENRVVLTNCIFWENLDMYGQITMNPFAGSADKMTINYCCVQGWTGQYHGTGNIDDDPCFAELGNWDANATPEDANDDFWVDGDYHLLAGSLCIDAGDPNYIAEPNTTDLDGRPRVLDGDNDGVLVVDMGAYEYRLAISAEVRILPQTINLASKGNWITCYIRLPDEYDVADVDPNSIFLENEIQPVQFSVDEQSQLMTARFARQDVQPILGVGDIDLKITGRLTDGTIFEASDKIKIINKVGKN